MTESFLDSDDPSVAKKGMSRREAMTLVGGLIVGGAIGAAVGSYAAPTPVAKEVVRTVTKTETVTGPAVTVTPGVAPVPTTPIKIGIQTFFKGGNAPLGAPLAKGAELARDQINAEGGVLGRKIELIERDEAGVDETVKEFKRLVLEDKVDFYIGLISSANTPAVAPHAEELGCITLMVDGCTDTVFDIVDRNPKFVFRNHIQGPDGIILTLNGLKKMKERGAKVEKLAYIHPDYAYGRMVHAHSTRASAKIIPESKNVYEAFVKFPGTTDFSAYITKTLEVAPDFCISSEWGGDWKAFYKQALGFGFFKKIPLFGSTLSHGCYPHFTEADFPDGHLAGVHANYWYEYPEWSKWPVNKHFSESYYKQFGEYPNFEAEGAWVWMWAIKRVVENIYSKLKGGWPKPDDIIPIMENVAMVGPAGHWFVRPDNHQGYKDPICGMSKADLAAGYSKLAEPYIVRISDVCAPAGWQHTQFDPKGAEPSATADWINKTWKTGEWPKGVPL